MSRRVNRVQFRLDTKGIKDLPVYEIKAILRGADDLIKSGGRSMLAKILKGSRDKKVLELGLDKSPVYGFFKEVTLEEITAKIDWLIIHNYLDIEYDGRLPLLVYTDKGWVIEKDTFTDELLDRLRGMLESGDFSFVLDLKDRNRPMILLLLDKIKATKDKRFIPLLQAWAEIDYKKVKLAINEVIESLERQQPFTVLPGGRGNIV